MYLAYLNEDDVERLCDCSRANPNEYEAIQDPRKTLLTSVIGNSSHRPYI